MRVSLALLLVCGSLGFANEPPTRQVKLNGQTFTLPLGFTIEMAARVPLTERPVAIALDDKGRLYVTESSGSNEPAQVQLAKKPHSILRLEDTNGDGSFDKKTVFADKLMFPQGILWQDGSIYVGTPPQIWKLTDSDDDGLADRREVWFDGQTLTGCLNDLHGPYAGPDGYIYWTKGAFAKQTHTLADGSRFVSRASHIFRMKPDQSGLDVVMTGGMDNPVDVAFTPKGDAIFTTTFFRHPGDGQRDGLIHAIYGGIYGKDHDVIHDAIHRWTGPGTMPMLTHLGPAAPCGLHRYSSDQFGPEYQDNLFCTQFNLRTVSRHQLVPDGSTYRTIDTPFLVSDSLDFHPTDVIEDRDGSLLIVDTGGWYKLCCPTSALVKDDVRGAIYRVRKTGAHLAAAKPRGYKLPELYAVALNRDDSKLSLVMSSLASHDPYTRRLAAHAAGRLQKADAIPAICSSLKRDDNDRALDHALTYALIEIGDRNATAKLLTDPHPAVQRAALAALASLGAPLPAEAVVRAIHSSKPTLQDTAWWLIERDPKLATALVPEFKKRLATSLSEQAQLSFAAELARGAGNPLVQQLLGESLANTSDLGRQLLLLKAMADSAVRSLPPSWIKPLGAIITRCEPMLLQAALAVVEPRAGKTLPGELSAALRSVGERDKLQLELQLRCLAAIPDGLSAVSPELFQKLTSNVSTKDDPQLVAAAANTLSKAMLTSEQLTRLAAILPTVGPLEQNKLLSSFERNRGTAETGVALFQNLKHPKVRGTLRAEQLQAISKNYPQVKAETASLQVLIDQDRAADRAKLERLMGQLKDGDIRRGQAIFYSQKAACSSCHKIGYVGGVVGPDMSRIGGIRSDRDLLEAIVLPSASFVRSYEPVKVTTQDGRVFTGILKQDSPSEVVLAINATETVRVPRADVESLTAGTVSVMPSGLDQQLSPQDLADLVAFLKSRK